VAQDITDDYGPLRQEHEYVLQNESNTFSKSNRYAFLLFIFVCFALLCFAPGHGKGLCDSEGGVSKHAVALAALHGSKLISPYDLFKYLKENCLDVSSKTTSALHSPDRRDFLYFKDGEFLNFHPIDLKIDRINCFHSFTISKQNPLECIDTAFHGAYHTNILDIQVMELVPENINLGLIMRESLLSYRTSYDKAYFVMIYQNANILRPTFALIFSWC